MAAMPIALHPRRPHATAHLAIGKSSATHSRRRRVQQAGYKSTIAARAVERANDRVPPDAPLEILLKEAFRHCDVAVRRVRADACGCKPTAFFAATDGTRSFDANMIGAADN